MSKTTHRYVLQARRKDSRCRLPEAPVRSESQPRSWCALAFPLEHSEVQPLGLCATAWSNLQNERRVRLGRSVRGTACAAGARSRR